MERHVLLSLLLLSLIVFDASDAFFVREHRKLANLDSGKKSPTQASTGPNQQNSDPNLVGNSSNSNTSSSPAPAPLKDSNVPQKEPAPAAENSGGGGNEHVGSKGGKENKENEMKIVSQSTTSETCDEKKKLCKDNGRMVGCISKIDPTYVVVLLHNGGNEAIKVKLVEGNLEDIEVGDQTKEVKISLTTSERTQLKFNAGKGDCVLHMGTLVPKRHSFVHLPSYGQIITPVNGAYFLILTVLLFGGTWACCKCRKKRHDAVPYQELEMAMPESISATNVESAEGWDQVWDDDWDDDAAVKSPATHHAGSISANGLTARSSNKDGWENNWDD